MCYLCPEKCKSALHHQDFPNATHTSTITSDITHRTLTINSLHDNVRVALQRAFMQRTLAHWSRRDDKPTRYLPLRHTASVNVRKKQKQSCPHLHHKPIGQQSHANRATVAIRLGNSCYPIRQQLWGHRATITLQSGNTCTAIGQHLHSNRAILAGQKKQRKGCRLSVAIVGVECLLIKDRRKLQQPSSHLDLLPVPSCREPSQVLTYPASEWRTPGSPYPALLQEPWRDLYRHR